MASSEFQNLSDEHLREVDAACGELESRLQNGDESSIEKLVSASSEAVRPAMLQELIEVELELRSARGETASESEYLKRFESDAEVVRRAFSAFFRDTAETAAKTPHPGVEESAAEAFPIPTSGSHATGSVSRVSGDDLPREFGRYTLLKLLGRGGMGAVFLAQDRQLDRQVALKMPDFRKASEQTGELIDRFYREARSMATLRHRGLCPVFDVGEIDGVHYLTMPFLDGTTLRDLTREGRSYPPAGVAAVLLKLAVAMAEAHRVGVIHRDLKPANIMVDRNHEPIIMDFGLAQRRTAGEETLTHSGDVLGTPYYMSPEQMRGDSQEIGPATDVYSLGVIGYELLTGQRPFKGSVGEVAAGILTSDPERPSSIKRGIDNDIECICLKAMARQLERRFATTTELIEALRKYLQDRQHSGPPTSVGRSSDSHTTLAPASGMLQTEVDLARNLFLELQTATAAEPERLRPRWPLIIPAVVVIAGLLCIAVAWPDWLMPRTAPSEDVAPIAASDTTQITRAETPTSENHALPYPVESDEPSGNPLLSSEFEWSEPVRLGNGVNTLAHEGAAAISPDGLTLFFVRAEDRLGIFRSQRTSTEIPFGPGRIMPIPVSDMAASDSTPFLTRDGLTLWFCSDRSGSRGKMDLWYSHRTSLSSRFEKPQPAGPSINTEDHESAPFVSADGLTLVFSRGFPRRIYQSSRESPEGPFDKPRRLTTVNDSQWSEFPQLSSDGCAMLLIMGTADVEQGIFLASRNRIEDDFGTPISLGPAINNFRCSGLSLSADDRTVYFATDRQNPQGTFDVWALSRVLKTADSE